MIDNNEGRSIHYYITFLEINQNILSIIVDNDTLNATLPNSIDFRFGRSKYLFIIHFNVIPRMLNELQMKFIDPFPISPILIDSKLSKFRNSNSPPKSAKL